MIKIDTAISKESLELFIEYTDRLSIEGAADQLIIQDSNRKNIVAEVVRADSPADLFSSFDFSEQRPIYAWEYFMIKNSYTSPLVNKLEEILKMPTLEHSFLPDYLKIILAHSYKSIPSILMNERVTNFTSMIRDASSILLFNGNFYGTQEKYLDAVRNASPSGGMPVDEEAMEMAEKGAYSKMSVGNYSTAKGGEFTGMELLRHPTLNAIIPEDVMRCEFVAGLNLQNLMEKKTGVHSLWDGGLKENEARNVSIGQGGVAVYPVNIRTVRHTALLVPIDYRAA